MTEPSPPSEPLTLQNRRIVLVGKLGSMNRKQARDAIRQLGGTVVDKIDDSIDILVVGADQLPFDEDGDWLDDWMIEASEQGNLEIISEAQLCQWLGWAEADWNMARLYTPAMLADLLKLPLSTIRRWHRRGLIRPVHQIKKLPYFDFQEVATARRIAQLIAAGASPQAIESKLSRLAELYPNLSRPLTQLSVIVEGKDILLRNDGGLIEPSGQMRLDFDTSGHEDTKVAISFENHPQVKETIASDPVSRISIDSIGLSTGGGNLDLSQFATPDEFIDLAVELEDHFEYDSAIEVYRSLALAFGPSADVCFRIAELLYQRNDLTGARERYYMAIELDENFVEARASLGCILMELNQTELARSAFNGALQHHPDYPDVHFHLARLLDDQDQMIEAEYHWRKFLELAPQSPWAAEAKQRLDG